MHTAARLPMWFSPLAGTTVVVDLPSPRGVGVIAVTTTYLPRRFSRSSRSIPSSVTFAFVRPYGSSSSSRRPRPAAISVIGGGVTPRAMSRSDGKPPVELVVAEVVGSEAGAVIGGSRQGGARSRIRGNGPPDPSRPAGDE